MAKKKSATGRRTKRSYVRKNYVTAPVLPSGAEDVELSGGDDEAPAPEPEKRRGRPLKQRAYVGSSTEATTTVHAADVSRNSLTFGEFLRSIRESRGITLREAAIGIFGTDAASQNLSNIEFNRVKYPSVSAMLSIGNFYRLPMEVMLPWFVEK